MEYDPNPTPLNPQPEELIRHIENEYQKLKSSINDKDFLPLSARNVAPTKPRPGLYYADGTNWNPGFGEGTYEYKNGNYTPLFDPVIGIALSRVTVDGNPAVDGTTPTTIISITIPTEAFRAGMVVRFVASGMYSNVSAADDWHLRYKMDGVTIHTLDRVAGNVTDEGWSSIWEGTIRTIGATGTFVDYATLKDDGTTYVSSDAEAAIDTTNDVVASLEFYWDNAKIGNVFHLDQGFIEFII